MPKVYNNETKIETITKTETAIPQVFWEKAFPKIFNKTSTIKGRICQSYAFRRWCFLLELSENFHNIFFLRNTYDTLLLRKVEVV